VRRAGAGRGRAAEEEGDGDGCAHGSIRGSINGSSGGRIAYDNASDYLRRDREMFKPSFGPAEPPAVRS
jgi:hypothetical protein